MMKEFVRSFCQAAREAGIEKLNFYMLELQNRNLSVYEDTLEHLEQSDLSQLYIQALVDGKMGSVFVENFDAAGIPELIANLQEDAQLCSDAFVPYDLASIESSAQAASGFLDLTASVDAMIRGAKAARQADSRIRSGIQLHVGEQHSCVTLANEQLQFVCDREQTGGAGIRLVLQEGDLVQPGGKHLPFLGTALPDLEKMAYQAVEKAASSLGAESCATGAYPVVLDAQVVGELLDVFMPAFFGSNIRSRMSVLAGRLGETVVGENISILEDPSLPGGFSARRFDDEGVPTRAKAIIREGVLENFLHNRKSAHHLGCLPGGNGFKPVFHEEPATGYTNVYIPAGKSSREQLLEAMGNGLLITGVSGVFAGARPNSGDFSLISNGYRVENGKIGRGVTQITIAGNFFEMLRSVEAIGNDAHWKCSNAGCVRTPSLYVRGLAVSGKE